MKGQPSDDINEPIETLINDIDRIATQTASAENPASNAIGLITVIGKFACIVGRLSRDAERQQRTMTRLTWAIFLLTFVLLVIAGLQLRIMLQPAASTSAAPNAPAASQASP